MQLLPVLGLAPLVVAILAHDDINCYTFCEFRPNLLTRSPPYTTYNRAVPQAPAAQAVGGQGITNHGIVRSNWRLEPGTSVPQHHAISDETKIYGNTRMMAVDHFHRKNIEIGQVDN